MNTLKLVFIIIFFLSASEAFASFDKLTRKTYEQSKNEKAVVIYGVSWGRQWGCAGLENAQLQKLTFSRIDPSSGNLDGENIELKTPSVLLAENISKPYAIIVKPGEYALTGFDVKIAKSIDDVRHLKAEGKDLFENGKPTAGTFKVGAGEIVYIGDFGLDCASDKPILWRYYIKKDDFDSYVAGFKKKHKFIGDKQVIYRLFQTNEFGH